MIEIKKCPFCGSSQVGAFNEYYGIGNIRIGFVIGVMCDDCGGAVISNDKHKSMNDMIAAWNKRRYDA